MSQIYVIEGVDSCGKTTICKRLSKLMGWKYISTPSGIFKKTFPEVEKFGDEQIGFTYLLSALLYTTYLMKKESKKEIIICDRYYPTILAYSKAINFNQDFVDLKKIPIVKPNKIIHIYVNYKKIKKRLKNKNHPSVDELTMMKKEGFYNTLVNEYRKYCDLEIDATNLSIDEVIKKVNYLILDSKSKGL